MSLRKKSPKIVLPNPFLVKVNTWLLQLKKVARKLGLLFEKLPKAKGENSPNLFTLIIVWSDKHQHSAHVLPASVTRLATLCHFGRNNPSLSKDVRTKF
jgi:hypothetical protein